QFQIADLINGTRSRSRRIAFHTKHELRARDDTLKSDLYALLEVPLFPPRLVELDRPLQIGVGHHPAICAAQEGRQNSPGARILVGAIERTTRKDAAAARGISGTRRVEGPCQGERIEVRMPNRVERVVGASDERLQAQRVGRGCSFEKPNANRM